MTVAQKVCVRCGRRISETASFCPKCGAAQPTVKPAGSGRPNWWTRRSGKQKAAIIVAALVVLVAVITGTARGGDSEKSADTRTTAEATTPSSDTTTTTTEATPTTEVVTSSTETASATVPDQVATGGEVHIINVGQGDSILVRTADNKVALIDGGESGSGALAYLKANGIDHVDLMIATHAHADHIGGLTDVLKAIPVAEVVTNGEPNSTATYEHFLDAIDSAKAVYREAKRGDKLQLGSLTFDVLSPENPGSGDDLNAGSLVLRLAMGNVSFLLAGDATQAAEASILQAGENVQAQVLKVGHHGSSSASSADFLAAVRPEVAIYCCGAGNDYGHPHAETLAALDDIGALVYGTDVNGTVVIESDGTDYQVAAEEGQPRAPPSSTTTTQTVVADLGIEVVSLTSPIGQGHTAKLTIKTLPGARCTITVYYKSGPSEAAGLGDQTASSSGTVTWQWKVGTRTTPGVWDIEVTAEAGGQMETVDIPFEVTE